MRTRNSAALGVLMSIAVGVTAVASMKPTYAMDPSPRTTPTPTYEMTPPGVEGDDGSLGGPVYDQNHQEKPLWVLK